MVCIFRIADLLIQTPNPVLITPDHPFGPILPDAGPDPTNNPSRGSAHRAAVAE
jgi:hypothetical protein